MEQLKKIHGSGTTTLVISKEEMNDIIKIVQALEDSNILLIGVNKTIKNDIKKQNGKGIGMLLGTLGASLLENLLTGKGTYRSGQGYLRAGEGIYRSGQGYLRAGEGIKKNFNATISFNKH